MAAGCAVIATDVGEDGTALGDAGIVIPAKPIRRRLASELQRLNDDRELRESLGVAARKRVEERFSLGVHIDRLLALYAAGRPS
jgi:glycosyltransferase involved in cell wall biosynthesis